ncbi:MAG: septal ring lytic transglycosylase RlpA family protein [Sphingobacteriales bacterium]|nr:MAG: septal ring lytic transglycosylase RlpA family protein [Sphingobacteriales bacterium]
MRMRLLVVTATLIMGSLGLNAQQVQKQKGTDGKGIASFYHDKFEGRQTATGEIFDNDKFTAASNKLKLGSYAKVTNLTNGEVVYVKINDRMNASNERLIDLASVAAKKLNFQGNGVTKVKVEAVSAQEGRMAISFQNRAKAGSTTNRL